MIFCLNNSVAMSFSNPLAVASPLSSAAIERLGWVLIHSIWQFAAIAIAAVIIGLILQHRSARERYIADTTLLLLMLIFPCATWVQLANGNPASDAQLSPTVSNSIPKAFSEHGMDRDVFRSQDSIARGESRPDRGEFTPSDHESSSRGMVGIGSSNFDKASAWSRFGQNVRDVLARWLNVIVTLWLVGVLLFSLRPACGLWTQWRYCHIGLSPVSDEIQKKLADLMSRLRMTQTVRVAKSALVQLPMVVGSIRPVVLLPISILSGLTPSQLECLLAHELAHIRRHDWLINAIQVLMETLFFYHPAVWWLSTRVRNVRELCCDDIAMELIGDNAAYGRMLLVLEESRHAAVVTPTAVAATGGNLVERVRRLMPVNRQLPQQRRGLLTGMLLLVGVFSFCVLIGSILRSDGDDSSTQLAAEKKKADQAPAGKPDQGGRSAYQISLTPNVSIELVGVTTPEFVEESAEKATDAKPTARWWSPDGTPLSQPPAAPPGKKLSLRTTMRGDLARDFLFRITGLDHPASMWSFVEGQGQDEPIKQSDGGTLTARIAGRPISETKSTEIYVAVAYEDWGPVQKIDVTAKPIDSMAVPDDYRKCYDAVMPLAVEAVGSATRFSFVGTGDLDFTAAFLAEAVDTDGASYPVTNRGGSGHRRFVDFSLPTARVSQIRYKLRPFSNLVAFKNASLETGRQTVVEIETRKLNRTTMQWEGNDQKDDSNQTTAEIEAKNSKIRAELKVQSEIDCSEITLPDILTYVGDLHNVSIEFDPAVNGNRDSMIVSLKSKTAYLADVLQMLLDPFDLSYVVSDGKLLVVPVDEVEKRTGVPARRFADVLAKLADYPGVDWDRVLRGQAPQADDNDIAILKAALYGRDAVVQQQAANALYWARRAAGPTIPDLKMLTQSTSWQVRRAAYFALAAIGQSDFNTLPFLIERWPQDEVAREDWFLLIRQFDDGVYTQLQKAFPNVSADLRHAIIRSAQGRTTSAKNLILMGLADQDEQVARLSLYAGGRELYRSDSVPDEFIRPLHQFLSSPNSRDRQFAADILLSVPDETEPILRSLLSQLADGIPQEKADVMTFFKLLPKQKTYEVVDRLVKRLNEIESSGPKELRSAATDALESIKAESARKKGEN